MSYNNDTTVSNLLQQLSGRYRDSTRVIRDITTVLNSRSTGLNPSITSHLENNGRETRLLSLSGTIPIVYRSGDGGRYNIPVEIFIPESYPVRPPFCYVRPVAGMAIKERHLNVGMDGTIYMPYLNEWRPRSHNLTEMIVWMQSLFGQNPPVFATSKPTVVATTNVVEVMNVSQPPPPDYDAILEQRRQAEDRRRAEEERRLAEEVEIRTTKETRADLTNKLKSVLKIKYDNARATAIEDSRRKSELEKGKNIVTEQIRIMKESKQNLQQLLDQVDVQTVKLGELIPQIESKGEVKVDDLAVPADKLSCQILQLSAKNAAYSDCLYHLQEANYKKNIETDKYLLSVRKLAYEQFLTRYHLKKVANVMRHGT